MSNVKQKMPSIGQYRNAVRQVREHCKYHELPLPKLTFHGTIKLHGTNASIQNAGDEYQYRSKNRVLVPGDDHAGFALHMTENEKSVGWLFAEIRRQFNCAPEDKVTVYGEWCGEGIQKAVGISQLPKMFVIFAMKINDKWETIMDLTAREEANIFLIVDFPMFSIEIDMQNPHLVQNKLADLTLKIEEECPVALHFGVEKGVGEGIVWKCVDEGWYSSDYWFKVKGEKHSSSRVSKLAKVDVEHIEGINNVVDTFVTESRLQQGLQEAVLDKGGSLEMRYIGDFLKWVFADIMKEESDTIAALPYEKKEVSKPISQKAKEWFLTEMRKADRL